MADEQELLKQKQLDAEQRTYGGRIMADEQTPGFTPGPWIARNLIPDGFVIRREGWEICTAKFDVCANIQHGAPIRNEADALLIASAPELLEACELAEQTLSGIPVAQTDITVLMNRIRAAIKKARGGER